MELDSFVFGITDIQHSYCFSTILKEKWLYIGNSYSQGDNICCAVTKLKEFKIPKPKQESVDSDNDSNAEEFNDMLYKQEVKEYVTRRNKYQ